MKEIKCLSEPIGKIQLLENCQDINIIKINEKEYSSKSDMQKKIKQPFELKILNIEEENIESIEFSILENHFSTKNIFIKSKQMNVAEDVIYKTVTAEIGDFCTKDFKKDAENYFRLIIPIDKKINFHYSLTESRFESETGVSRELTKVRINSSQLDLYLYNHKEKYYLCIDCNNRLNFEEFSNLIFSIIVSFAYINGNLVGDEGYFFAYNEKSMKGISSFSYQTLRSSSSSIYRPIYSNPYGYQERLNKNENAEILHKNLRPLTEKEFSYLCTLCYDNIDFRAILLTIIEGMSSSSLLVMPGNLAIALEGLTKILVPKNSKKSKVIENDKIFSKIKKELNNVIDNNATKLEGEQSKILKNKISNLNQAANADKLTNPFDIVGYKLSEEDIITISKRNQILHGSMLANDREIYYYSLNLYKLLSVLILKKIGYDNYFLNLPKIYENICRKELDENVYIKL